MASSREPLNIRRAVGEQAAVMGELSTSSPNPTRSRAQSEAAKMHYTVFVRLPFPRGDFVDPPLVNWDQAKDRTLWQILSNNPSGGDIDWKELATKFDVTLPFILQQAAWLYERQLSQVRAQMRKVGKVSINPAAPGLASPRVGSLDTTPRPDGTPLLRAELGEGRPPSSFSARAQPAAVVPVADSISGSSRTRAPPISRNASTSTVTQSRPMGASSSNQPGAFSSRALTRSISGKGEAKLDENVVSDREDAGEENPDIPASGEEEMSSSSSSSSDPEPPRAMLGSQRFRRTTRFAAQKPGGQRPRAATLDESTDNNEDDEEDEDETPAFLPYSRQDGPSSQDMAATLKTNVPRQDDSRSVTDDGLKTVDSSPSSATSSAAAILSSGERLRAQKAVGPISPKQRAELAGLSPRRLAAMKDGSDGAPSMGSSFSDLNDASVTKSALEEALLSNYQRGGGTSRMSSID